jgi:hypothetical protein
VTLVPTLRTLNTPQKGPNAAGIHITATLTIIKKAWTNIIIHATRAMNKKDEKALK